jgi:hypothetical protein
MNKLGTVGFPVAFAASVIATIVFFTAPGAVAFSWLTGGFVLSLVLGACHPGEKTRLQYMFASIGAILFASTLAFSWGWGGWAGIGLCAFMVLTMKLDGGDSYGG